MGCTNSVSWYLELRQARMAFRMLDELVVLIACNDMSDQPFAIIFLLPNLVLCRHSAIHAFCIVALEGERIFNVGDF